jgi:hypothetical protein
MCKVDPEGRSYKGHTLWTGCKDCWDEELGSHSNHEWGKAGENFSRNPELIVAVVLPMVMVDPSFETLL